MFPEYYLANYVPLTPPFSQDGERMEVLNYKEKSVIKGKVLPKCLKVDRPSFSHLKKSIISQMIIGKRMLF